MHLIDFSAKLEAIALPSQAIATVKAMAVKSKDSLKLMRGGFPTLITPTPITRPRPALQWAGARCGYNEGHTSALAQGSTLTHEKKAAQSISGRTTSVQVKGENTNAGARDTMQNAGRMIGGGTHCKTMGGENTSFFFHSFLSSFCLKGDQPPNLFFSGFSGPGASWNEADANVASRTHVAWLWMLTVSSKCTLCLQGSQLGFPTLITLP